MFLLTVIKSPEFITLVSGLIIAIVIFILYNSSWVIRKKKKAEAIQKLKLDSIIEIINGVGELQSAVEEIRILMYHIVQDMLKQIQKQNYSQINEIVNEASYKFFKESRSPNKRIDNFASLLEKELILNEEMSREHRMIEEEFIMIGNIPKEMINDIEELNNSGISRHNIVYIKNKFIEQINRGCKNVDIFAVHIRSIYKIKLDKEQESLFGNFLKIIGFSKILNWIIFLLRNQENENKLEEALKVMEQREKPHVIEHSEASV